MRYFQLFIFIFISFSSISQEEDKFLQKIVSSTSRRTMKDSVLVNKLNYAGANNPLWVVRHKSDSYQEVFNKVVESDNSALCLLEITPDKMPVGYQFETPPPFITRTIDVLPEDLFVLISDGFADQFGLEKGKKLKSLTLKKMILENQMKSMNDLKGTLEEEFESWKGNEEQVDDVCIVGVKVSSLT